MVKYTRNASKLRKRRRTRRRIPKTLRRRHRKYRGGYSPIGPNGGNYGHVPDSYPATSSGALPDPAATQNNPAE